MKKALLLILSILILCVGAYADLTVSSPTIGGTDQERNVVATKAFTVTNTATTAVNVTGLTSSAESKYEVTFSPATFVLPASGTQTVTVSAKVPKNFNAVDSDLKEAAFKIGEITVTGTEGTTTKTGKADLKMQAENKLSLRKGKATIKGLTGTTTDSFRDAGSLKDLKPGDELNFEITVENNFPSSGSRETDMDDVEVTLELSDDSDFDMGEDRDDFSLSSKDTEVSKLDFAIVEDAVSRTYTMTIKADATDENGARHGAVMLVSLEVKRDAHDLVLRKASLSPSRLVCGASRKVTLTGEVLNRGRLDEDEAVVEVRSDDLAVVEKSSAFELNEDDTHDVKLQFTVPADATGTFNIDALTSYDLTKENNVKTLTLTVDECKEEVKLPEPVKTVPTPEPKKEEVTPVVQVPPGVVTQPGQTVQQGVPPARVTSTFRESNNYLLLLAVACAVILVLIVALLAATAKRR
ncbi:hypothetical protein HY837_00245 [archaeon]|nr:hypothetical protein [archaeon]